MQNLYTFGWNDHFQSAHTTFESQGLEAGRIISIRGYQYHLQTERGLMITELTGNLLHSQEGPDLPKVGDWVSFFRVDTQGYIVHVLPRQNALIRKSPGKRVERQVLATNIDQAFIVQSLDQDFNLRRLERYLFQIRQCEIQVGIILHKIDVVEKPEAFLNQVKALEMEVPILLTSTQSQAGIDQLRQILEPMKTYVFIGSSGVGKSSLINALAQEQIRVTGEVSQAHGKGKHTTTSRDLIQLPNESLLIDTPGMREFGLTHEVGQNSIHFFPRLSELAEQCRFSDCSHTQEPGCAVLKALKNGEISQEMYDSFQKLQKEQARFETHAEEKKRKAKRFGRIVKEANAFRKKRKY